LDNQTQLRNFVIFWNNSFILDYWFRKKHKIAFNSKAHRKTEPLDIMIEWEEEQLSTVIHNQEIQKRRAEDFKKTGVWLMPKTEEVAEDFYDNIGDDFWEQFDNK
jgi:uncharacterized membrane protein YcaP (DUF421 family)